jgi:hypothetical protein
MKMSLTKSAPMTTPKSLPVKHIAAVLIAIAIIVTVAFTASQLTSQTGATDSAPQQLSQRELLELNTTAMPVMSVGAAVASDAAVQRFIEINTTALPTMRSATGPEVRDEFLYWNVDAFPSNPGARVQPFQPAGPR